MNMRTTSLIAAVLSLTGCVGGTAISHGPNSPANGGDVVVTTDIDAEAEVNQNKQETHREP